MDDKMYGHKKILREVTDAFSEQGGGKLGVIIGVDWDHTAADVEKALRALKVQDCKHTDLYVWAELTEDQVKKVADKPAVFKIWHDRKIRPLVAESAKTMKSRPAHELFSADGNGIAWAVLDTGIKDSHQVFSIGNPVVKKKEYNFTAEPHTDSIGHGTHVAGIIKLLAPEIELYDFKVLGEGGSTSFTLIQAMYQIRRLNFEAPMQVIHGANLSLGGQVPVGSYGCGFSPECQEADRLMRSGVVVCVAASNDGHKTLATITSKNELEYFSTFMNMGISDPGNAQEVITVGSTHKSNPHQYGVSWFSSKGPTGDGRYKPDVVAPGEQIESAGIGSDDEFVKMSGTSMATPMVSGAIAQFLSVKPEFIGQTHKVKELLMSSCTDLNRDKCFQGAGLVDVFRMIQSV